MAIVGGLTIGTTKTEAKVAAVSASITGTGAITSGLSAVDAGSAQVTPQNAATTLPSVAVAAVTSIAGGTVNVIDISLNSTPAIALGGATNIGLLCTGS